MRARRTVYIVIFVVASPGCRWRLLPCPAARRDRPCHGDIAVLTQITDDMVEVVRVSPLDAPPNTARSLDAVVGRYAALPILAGQDVDGRAIEATPDLRRSASERRWVLARSPSRYRWRPTRPSAARCRRGPASTSSPSRTRSRRGRLRRAQAQARSRWARA